MLRFQTKRTPLTAMVPDGQTLWIADGPGPRGNDHAVVFRGEEMVHDPHPSRAGLSHAHGVTILVSTSDPIRRAVTDFRTFAEHHGFASAVVAVIAVIPGAILSMVASAAERGIRRALGLRSLDVREDEDPA